MSQYPLFELSPALKATVPAAGLLTGPTPVQASGDGNRIWFKRDDLSAADYGGNKVRKLDFLLADCKARGCSEVVTFGYAGSNFVAATAWHGRKLGLATRAYLLPQVPASYVADNLSVGLHAGARLQLLPSTTAVGAAALLGSAASLFAHRRLPAWIPPGGSAPLGVLGFMNAALELRQQIEAGQLPAPESIYVAFSSMGTVAGLALGLELAGLPTRIVAAQVVDDRFASEAKLRKLVLDTRRHVQRLDPRLACSDAALERVQIRNEFFGEEYARPTPLTIAAIGRFTGASGARADSAYSGKALACLYHDLDAGRLGNKPVLFWHTFSARALPPGVQRASLEQVPVSLRHYFAGQ